MSAQVAEIQKSFRSRLWALRHLGHRGMAKSDLLKVYKSILLPIHDYCSCVYNSSLTQNQVNALERLQAQALKSIYGYKHSYRSLLQLTGLNTLKERRDARPDKFFLPNASTTRGTKGGLNPITKQEPRGTPCPSKRAMREPRDFMTRLYTSWGGDSMHNTALPSTAEFFWLNWLCAVRLSNLFAKPSPVWHLLRPDFFYCGTL